MVCENRGEAWARQRLQRNEPIKFPVEWSELERSVSGEFVIEAILDPGWAGAPTGFMLANALITEPVNRRYVHVRGELLFEQCTFQSEIAFAYGRFERRVCFVGCSFKSDVRLEQCSLSELSILPLSEKNSTVIQGTASFRASEMAGSLDCTSARFCSGVDCTDTKIGGPLVCNRVEFGSPNKTSFNGVKVANSAFFEHAEFHGMADFLGANIEGQLVCVKAKFINEQAEANFNSITVGSGAFFREAEFRGPANFGSAQIGKALECQGTKFRSGQAGVSFRSITTESGALFRGAEFYGPVDFGGARIGSALECQGAKFLSEQGMANFNAIAAQSANFLNAEFRGPVNLGHAKLDKTLECQGTQFLKEHTAINLNSLKAPGGAFLDDAIFCGGVDFGYAEIGINLQCSRTRFVGEDQRVDLSSIKVGGDALFLGAEFRGRVDLSNCTFSHDVHLPGAQFQGPLDLSNVSIGGTLHIFTNQQPGQVLVVFNTQLPPLCDLRGLRYDRTDLEHNHRWQDWIRLRRGADTYDPGPYLVLENSFRRAGEEALADSIYYAMRTAEARWLRRRMRVDWFHNGWKLLGNWILRCTVGYGVYGWRLILWVLGIFLATLAVISIGNKLGVVKQSTPATPVPFSPFAYALEVLLPGGLPIQGSWRTAGWLTVAAYFARILGWAIVPLAAAQIAGLLKRRQ